MAESVVGDSPTYADFIHGKYSFSRCSTPSEQSSSIDSNWKTLDTRSLESLLESFHSIWLWREIRDAWLEGDRGETAEAQRVSETDQLECMILEHDEYRRLKEKDLEKFQKLS